MPGNDLPIWVNYAQALVVPFVAVVGAGIAGGQLLLARRKMQLDLYDRRYKLFESARRLIVDVMREGRIELESIYAYHRDTGDAVFLLDSAAVSYIAELEKRSFRLRRLHVILLTMITLNAMRRWMRKRICLVGSRCNSMCWSRSSSLHYN